MKGLLLPPERIKLLYNQYDSTHALVAATINTSPTLFNLQYTVLANTLVAGVTLRVTGYLIVTCTTVTQDYQLLLGATVIYRSVAGFTPSALTTRSLGFQFLITGTAAAGASVPVDTASLFSMDPGATIAIAGAMVNTIDQPVNVATNADKVLALQLTYGANTAGQSIRLQQLIIEQIGP